VGGLGFGLGWWGGGVGCWGRGVVCGVFCGLGGVWLGMGWGGLFGGGAWVQLAFASCVAVLLLEGRVKNCRAQTAWSGKHELSSDLVCVCNISNRKRQIWYGVVVHGIPAKGVVL